MLKTRARTDCSPLCCLSYPVTIIEDLQSGDAGGLLLLTALLQRPLDGNFAIKAQAFGVIHSLLDNSHVVPEVLRRAAESLLNRLQAAYSIASLLDMGHEFSQCFGQMIPTVPGALLHKLNKRIDANTLQT